MKSLRAALLCSALLAVGPLEAQTVSGNSPVGANPSATVATSAVNGSAGTFMRSDAAPAMGNLTGDVTSVGLATTLATTQAAAHTFSAAGAASTPGVSITGALFLGTGTTSTPQLYVNLGASAPSSWSTNGTPIGVNAPSGFSGRFIDFHINGGGTLFSVDQFGDTAQASANIQGQLQISSHRLCDNTVPTIANGGGLGTVGAIVGTTCAFDVTAGTGAASVFVITLSAAANGWVCKGDDITTHSTTVSSVQMAPGTFNTTTVTMGVYSDVSVLAAAGTGDHIRISCLGY